MRRREFLIGATGAAGAVVSGFGAPLQTGRIVDVSKYVGTTITIQLSVVDGQVVEQTTYSHGSAYERKAALLSIIRADKANRTKSYIVPWGDHSEHLEHPSWITKPDDMVRWVSQSSFMLSVDYDLGPCDSMPGTPRNPFGWRGTQLAQKIGDLYVVEGIAQRDGSLIQRFYKYTASIEGAEPLDPDGICDR
jgi:hypothetical protein